MSTFSCQIPLSLGVQPASTRRFRSVVWCVIAFPPNLRRRRSLRSVLASSRGYGKLSIPLDFIEFVDLFRAFILRTRKDLKNLFDQLTSSEVQLNRSLPREQMRKTSATDCTGEWTMKKVKQLLCIASIMTVAVMVQHPDYTWTTMLFML